MSIKDEIYADLQQNGRSTTTSIAARIDYSTGWILKNAKEMKADGRIEGEKAKRIPAYIINDDYVVITSSREQLLSIVKQHAPSALSRAQQMNTKELQDFIRDHIADQVVGGPFIWEFWV